MIIASVAIAMGGAAYAYHDEVARKLGLGTAVATTDKPGAKPGAGASPAASAQLDALGRQTLDDSSRKEIRFGPIGLAPGDQVGKGHGVLHGQLPVQDPHQGLQIIGQDGIAARRPDSGVEPALAI